MKPFDEAGVFCPAASGISLSRLAVRAAGVTIFSHGLGFATQMVATIILARILAPADFGVLAMVTTFSLLFMNVGLNGFTEAILQRDEIDHWLASNVFWINAGLGLLLTVLFIALAPVLAAFYGDARILSAAAVISVTILLSSLSVQHLALLKRAMQFSTVSVNDIVARLMSVVVAVVLGWAGWGDWALIGGAIALSLSTCLGAWSLCRWTPSLPRRHPGTFPTVRFALNTYGRFATTYCTWNLDNLLLGWRFGPTSLGYYKKAYDLFVLPMNQLSSPLTAVAISSLSRLSARPSQQKAYLLRALATLAFVGMGLAGYLTLAGKDLVLLLLGPGWDEAGRIFTYFGPGIGVMLLYSTNGWIHLSVGRADRWFRWGLVELTVTAILFVLALPHGPIGMAVAWVVAYATLVVPALWYAGRPIDLRVSAVVAVVWRYLVAAVLSVWASFTILQHPGAAWEISGPAGAAVRLVVTLAVFGLAYFSTVAVLHGGFGPFAAIGRLLREMAPGNLRWQVRPTTPS